jgi:NADH-quinone oxidoreductase subunit N
LWATHHVVLVLIAAAVSVVGVFYYLRIVKLMYFDAPGDLPGAEPRLGVRLALGINALAVLALGLLPNGLLALCAKVLS